MEDTWALDVDARIAERPKGDAAPPAGDADGDDAPLEAATVLAVFDGHGGDGAAVLARDSALLEAQATDAWKRGDAGAALSHAFRVLDWRLCVRLDETAGTTALVAVVRESGHVTLANCGDCRAIVVKRNGATRAVTVDHSPETAEEQARIASAGGVVSGDMVDGLLSVSRALGDPEFKFGDGRTGWDESREPEENDELPVAVVTSQPDIVELDIADDDDLLLLASDGIWAVLSTERVGEIVHKALLDAGNGIEDAVDAVLAAAEEACTGDNSTVLLHRFAH